MRVDGPETASEPLAQEVAHLRNVVGIAPRDLAVARQQVGHTAPWTKWLPGDEGREVGFKDLRKEGGTGAGVPLFRSGFPALAVRSSKIQYNGKKRRSCSPSWTYVISCRDSDPWYSAGPTKTASLLSMDWRDA
jgi:hypothetical protein